MVKKIILWVLTLLCFFTIFAFSSQVSSESSKVSEGITKQIARIFTNYDELSEKEQQEIVENLHGFIRSVAHFSIYLALGFFLSLLLNSYNIRHRLIVTMIICMSYSVFDELYQGYFVPGRACEFVDMLKDWSGSFVGFSISVLATNLSKKIKKAARHTP